MGKIVCENIHHQRKNLSDSDISYSLPGITLRNHQNLGIESWISNSKRGILKASTGSGKTITAISIIVENEIEHGSNVVVMVPGKNFVSMERRN